MRNSQRRPCFRHLYIAYLASFIFLIGGCNNDTKEASSCSYEKLVSESVQTNSTNGHKISLEIEGKILANIKKLGDVEGKFRASDSIYLNLVSEIKKQTVNYSDEFLATHNAIVQILCDIENQIQDSTLNTEQRAKLFQEKMDRRTEYFDFLLGKASKTTIPPPTDNPTTSDAEKTKKPTPQTNDEGSSSSNSAIYFDQKSRTDIAILTLSNNKLSSDLNSILSQELSSKGFSTSPAFFRSAFVAKFADRLSDNDASVFQNLGIQDHANCICVVNQRIDYKPNEYENNSYQTAVGKFNVSVFHLNESIGTQTFQFSTQGAGADQAMALESLSKNFITIFNKHTLNLDVCKK
jgi:hypothetical protein